MAKVPVMRLARKDHIAVPVRYTYVPFMLLWSQSVSVDTSGTQAELCTRVSVCTQ